jgi:hypothetical protein
LYQVCYKPGDLHLNDESKLQLWKEDTLCNCVGEARMSWDSSFLKRKVRSKGKVDETKEDHDHELQAHACFLTQLDY